MIDVFKHYLKGTNLFRNTQEVYLYAVMQYCKRYGDNISKKNLRDYKIWLIENFSPKTVNLRLRGINCLLESQKKDAWKMNFVRESLSFYFTNGTSIR
jgi:hypothetical protein